MIGYKKILIVLFVNLAIASGFYYGNLDANVTEISSDLGNIIPICKKLDNPNFFEKDMYLGDINDVKYYTPFYVESLRAMAKLTGGDYVQALNLLSFVIHFLYGTIWFFFFWFLRKDFWMALIFSVFFRGILWPPGGELLGISDLWTAMPRTLFIALAPLPFLVYASLKKYKVLFSALVLGLILNFHPISGIGMIICYFTAYTVYIFYTRRFDAQFYKDFALAAAFCFVGMLPYMMTYLGNIKVDMVYSEAVFNLAFKKRLGDTFVDPVQFIPQWKRPILFFLAAFFAGYYFFDTSERKRNFKILAFTIAIVFLAANSFVYIENGLNSLLHKNIRMAFQLIRIQKFVLVLLQIGMYLFLVEACRKYSVSEMSKKIAAVSFAVMVSLSSLPFFSKIPLVGDDLITSIFPHPLKFGKPWKSENLKNKARMIAYITEHTDPESVFFGDCLIRTGANRSVVLDKKGAGMLIEGNRNKFVQWYTDTEKLEKLPVPEKVAFLKSKGVDYIMSENPWEILVPEKSFGNFYLYKL